MRSVLAIWISNQIFVWKGLKIINLRRMDPSKSIQRTKEISAVIAIKDVVNFYKSSK